jgi:hypothetical protein
MSRRLVVFMLVEASLAAGQPAFQADPHRAQNRVSAVGSPLLNSDQSSVYMEFRRVGKCQALSQGENTDRIWLGLKNNTRWTVLVTANGVEDECYGEASPWYRVEANGSAVPEGPIPYGHWPDVGSILEIEPGEVLNFSVPKVHLDPGLSIRIDFRFYWEENTRYTRYSSLFSYWDLPDALRDTVKEKKLKCVGWLCTTELKPAPSPRPIEIPDPPLLPRPAVPMTVPSIVLLPLPLPNLPKK